MVHQADVRIEVPTMLQICIDPFARVSIEDYLLSLDLPLNKLEVGKRVVFVCKITRRKAALIKSELTQVAGHLRLASPVSSVASLLSDMTDLQRRTHVKRPGRCLSILIDVAAFVRIVPPLVQVRISACHHHCTAGRTNDRGPRRFHPASFGCHLIKHGRFGPESLV